MLHDCSVETDARHAEVRMSPLVAELNRARKERLNRIKVAALVATMVEVKPVFEEQPEPVKDSWVERQKRIPMPKQRWFSIVEDLGPIEPRAPLVEEIVHACSKYFTMSKREILANRRTANGVYARHVAMYLAKTLTQSSLPQIGRKLGKRDHTTILHGVRKITARIQTDWTVAYDVAHVEAML